MKKLEIREVPAWLGTDWQWRSLCHNAPVTSVCDEEREVRDDT